MGFYENIIHKLKPNLKHFHKATKPNDLNQERLDTLITYSRRKLA